MTFYIKENDTVPSIRATLKDGFDAEIDLIGASVRFLMRAIGSNVVIVDEPAVIVSEIGGLVQYDWVPADTAAAGSYQAEFEVTYPNTNVETFPNDGYIRVNITGDIA